MLLTDDARQPRARPERVVAHRTVRAAESRGDLVQPKAFYIMKTQHLGPERVLASERAQRGAELVAHRRVVEGADDRVGVVAELRVDRLDVDATAVCARRAHRA